MATVKQCRQCKHDGGWQTYGSESICAHCRDWAKFEPKDPVVPVPFEEGVTHFTRNGVSYPLYKDMETPIKGNQFISNGSSRDVQIGGDHYKDQGIQPIDYIFANKLGFCEGNVIKYVTRYQKKNGVQDLKKARHYLDMLIEELEKTNAA